MFSKTKKKNKEEKKIFIHFMEAQGNFGFLKNQIREIIYETFNESCKEIDLDKIDILVEKKQNVKEFKKMDGIVGFCFGSKKIAITIDTKYPSVKESIKKVLKKVLFHEFHHLARFKAGEKIANGTFLEALVGEGLSDNFVYYMIGEKTKWVINLKEDKEKRLIKKIKKIINKKMDYKDYEKWFFNGSKEEDIPRWAGYSIAYKIIKNFISNHPNETAASLASKPIEYFSNII